MNRRDLMKALAGIPLLGLLVKLPETKDRYHEIDVLTFNGASHRVDSTWDYTLIGDEEPFLTMASNKTSGPTMTYWDGQQWIPMRVECPRSWKTELA